MKWKESFKIAWSMYSAVPMPYADWSRENMKYALCFFPMIGLACFAGLAGWSWLAQALAVKTGLFAAICVLIPFLVTGGIHMDGFCDTSDALFSHQDTGKKLEILKDSHSGAFAVMACGLYLLVSFGLWSQLEVSARTIGVLGIGFVMSRSFSGLSVVRFRCAKDSGLLAAFSNSAEKNRVAAVMIGYLAVCAAAMVVLSPIEGGFALIGALAAFGYYRMMSYRQFGGITGDLAGYFLVLCELLMLAGVVLAQLIG